VNTARGELIDPAALADAIEASHVAGAALDVFETEPPTDRRLVELDRVIATPHIAASTAEAQDLVGLEVALAVRDFLDAGVVRNAVNFPSVPEPDVPRLRPFLDLATRLGAFVAQLAPERPQAIGVRYYGDLVETYERILTCHVLAGALQPFMDAGVTPVNARPLAAQRGVDVIESRSTRPRDFGNVISVKLRTASGEQWVEGTVFQPASPRLCTLDGIAVEMPLAGSLLVIRNADTPGVIGDVGATLGRHGINIGSFTLGRAGADAVGVISVDQSSALEAAAAALGRLPAIKDVRVVRL
jgi:D-3-phosphoglycerate dehydrogenase